MYGAISTQGDILSTENNISGKFLGKPQLTLNCDLSELRYRETIRIKLAQGRASWPIV